MHKKNYKSFFYLLLCCFILSNILNLGFSRTVYSQKNDATKTASFKINSGSNNLKLNIRTMKLTKGNKIRLTVTNLKANYTVSYDSVNKTIATVDNYGYVLGRRNGTTTVTATIKYKTRTVQILKCSVSVGPSAVSIVIPKSELTMFVGTTRFINYIIKPSNTVEVPTFSSSNKKIASVSAYGQVTALKPGVVTITAKISNRKSDTCKIKINKAPNKKSTQKK